MTKIQLACLIVCSLGFSDTHQVSKSLNTRLKLVEPALRELEARGLVYMSPGAWWAITNAGEQALRENLDTNPHTYV